MREIFGVKVLDSLEEIINPNHSVLIVWDVLRSVVDKAFNKDEFITNLNKLIEGARKVKVPIFFTKRIGLNPKFQSPALLYFYHVRLEVPLKTTEAMYAIDIKDSDIIFERPSLSIFTGTNFERMLRNSGRITIILAGISTEVGVETTARDAISRGFYAVVVEDACSSQRGKEFHDRAIQNMRYLMPVVKTNEILKIWLD